MAYDILAKYGIKEVADVTFYELDDAGKPTNPVLYLDTLKVSTIEQTAENTSARGGKGNPELIMWDYNKEITVTLEDALFSAKSMAIMFGNGKVSSFDSKNIMKTEEFIAATVSSIPTEASTVSAATVIGGWNQAYVDPNGSAYVKVNPKFYDAEGNNISASADWNAYAGRRIFCSYDLIATGSVIDINPTTFPGCYYVTGDTYARSEASGKDEFFQFIIPKAKIQSENTLTLEAEGDPTVFNMNLKVLRPANGSMMRLVKYNLENGEDAPAAGVDEIIHNHSLKPETANG